MAILKIDVINDAYSQIRISGLTINPNPEDITVALIRLDGMMAEFDASNLRLNYQFEEDPDPSTDTGVALAHRQMMATNLAMRLLADFGKPIPQPLFLQANQSLSNSNSIVSAELVNEVQYPNRQPRGSGNTVKGNRWYRYYAQDNTPPTDSNIIIRGDTRDYKEFFSSVLVDGDEIDTYTITADSGLDIVSSSNDTVSVSYRVNAPNDVQTDSFRQIKIIISTTNGLQYTRLIDFEIQENKTIGSNE